MTYSNPKPLVSIVTPSYNQAAYLEQTMRSVLAQDLSFASGREKDFPLEYIVVDGLSTDGSQDIIQRYQDRLAWWASEADSGQAEAINKGLQRARGDIVAWLNSDDLYLPGAVRAAVTALQATPELGMVFGDAITIDARGKPLNKLVFGDWSLAELMGFRIICQPAVFMRRAVLEKAGFLDQSYHYMLDHHLWLRMACLAPIQHVPAFWAAARHHPRAKNVAQPEGFGRETLRLLEWMRSQASLVPQLERQRRRVEAGAHRLNARYLLDGGLAGPALKEYGQALRLNPGFAIKHWHRMIYAALSLIGVKGLASTYYRMRQARPLNLAGLKDLDGWPGLLIEGN